MESLDILMEFVGENAFSTSDKDKTSKALSIIGNRLADADIAEKREKDIRSKLEVAEKRNIELEQVVKDIGSMWRKTCNEVRDQRYEAQVQVAVTRKTLEEVLGYIQSSREGCAGVKVYVPGPIDKKAVLRWREALQSSERTCSNCAFDKCLDASARHFKGCKNWRSEEAQP